MAKKRRKKRRIRYGRLLVLILLVIGVLFLFFRGISILISSFQTTPEPLPAEPTPTPDPVYKNNYDWSFLKNDEGRYRYEDENYTSSFGIDVSHYQGSVDWQAVKNAGVEFVFIRAGYRGYTEGVLHEDEFFRENIQKAVDAGLEIGVYFFSQAVDAAEGEEEAGFLLNLIKDYPIEYCVFDLEIADEEQRTYTNDAEINTAAALAFCKKINESGYTSMVYGSKSFLMHDIRMVDLQDTTQFWLAGYGTDTPEFPYVFSMWQYSCEGEIDGISTNVDLNIRFNKK